MNHPSSTQQQAGLTLVELMIVVAIMGIMLAVSAPKFSSFIPNMQLRSAVMHLYSNMQNTRLNAIKTNTTWAIVFDPPGNRYLICSNKGPDGSWSATADNTCPTIVDFTLSYQNGIQYGHGALTGTNSAATPPTTFPTDGISFSSNVLSFSPQGMSGAGYVYLENQTQTCLYAIGALSSGAINIKKWNGTAWKK